MKFDYTKLSKRALIAGVIVHVMETISKVDTSVLPEEERPDIYLTFDTTHPMVEIPEWLRTGYPTDMTIVLNNQFRDLVVLDGGMQIGMWFNKVPATLYVPWAALQRYYDRVSNFNLTFDSSVFGQQRATPPKTGSAAVVSLDDFRKGKK